MNSNSHPCPICQSQTDYHNVPDGQTHIPVNCLRCGSFTYTSECDWDYFKPQLDLEDVRLLSAYIRWKGYIDLTTSKIKSILGGRIPSVNERAEKLLEYLSIAYPSIGEQISDPRTAFSNIRSNHGKPAMGDLLKQAKAALPLVSASFSISHYETEYLLGEYLAETAGYLKPSFTHDSYTITPEGWALINKRTTSNENSKQGFVAMRFSDKMKPIYDHGIKLGFEGTGYSPKIMNEYDHNKRIDDEIEVQIQRSKFVVADLTEQNQGVYYEAGFAIGKGIPVIWICNKNEKEKIHFDNRQYNTILYSDKDMNDLIRRLQNRIINTIKSEPSHP